jgi:hypothetical protein
MVESSSKRKAEVAFSVMLKALLRAHEWINRDEMTHGRTFGTGNEIRDAIELATGERPAANV